MAGTMSGDSYVLSTRVNGFTAWVNVRLSKSGHFMHNVLTDLLKGYNMKVLLESMTGRPHEKVQSFDGLTQQQKVTRVEWIIAELKTMKVIPKDTYIDTRMFAMRSANQVFELLWCLVCHDIWFVWERSHFLQQTDEKVLLSKSFNWVPPPPPPATPKHKIEKNMMLGFGARSVTKTAIQQPPVTPEAPADTDHDDGMVKRKISRNFPAPDYCILDMINSHLKMTREGRKLTRGVESLDDLTDSRVLCALVNSIVPDTFTSEVLLNDRWTIDLVLYAANEMFRCSNPFDSKDLAQGDVMSVCAYFAFFFMCGYKFKQSKAAVKRVDQLKGLRVGLKDELSKFPDVVESTKDVKKKKELELQIRACEEEIEQIEHNFDYAYCHEWVKTVADVQNSCREIVTDKIMKRFDVIKVPRNTTINDLAMSMIINLSLTCGTAFYLGKLKESFSPDRRIVLRHKETGDFYDDFTGSPGQRKSVRRMLGVKENEVIEINPDDYPQYDVFFESSSRNKTLRAGTLFLYQVFPGNTLQCQRLLFKACKTGELDTAQKLVIFFQNDKSFINSREHGTGNTALHLACRHGYLDIVLFLLENGADIDRCNINQYTPFFLATESLHKEVAELLIEWGADVLKRDRGSRTAFDLMRHVELRKYLEDKSVEMKAMVSRLVSGDPKLLGEVVERHHSREQTFISLRSRCVSGSTLLHTAAFFGAIPVIKMLLSERVDVNLLDYKGATPLHRAKDADTVEVLLEAGGDLDAEDQDGNTPLHVKCYGDSGLPTDKECIETMLVKKAPLTTRNSRSLMPIHCAAMQGRVDAIELLLHFDSDGKIGLALESEGQGMPPSLIHLAVANDFLSCAEWLTKKEFLFKDGEADLLVHKILLDEIICAQPADTVRFLLQQGAAACPSYPGGNTALHLIACKPDGTDLLDLFLSFGADIDCVNDDQCTPLFFATQSNCMYSASVLIEKGANVRTRNYQGLSAFDFITDFEEWIECGYFSEEVKARLKAYSLKHARDLIRAISKKVKPQLATAGVPYNSGYPVPGPARTPHLATLLPPIKR